MTSRTHDGGIHHRRVPLVRRDRTLDVRAACRPSDGRASLDREFAVVYRLGPGKNGGGGKYYLHSGTRGEVEIPIAEDVILVSHTHPGGAKSASAGDRRVLKALELAGSPQRSSEIVADTIDGIVVVRFNQDPLNYRTR